MREDDRRLDYCLNCTDCNAACPVMKVLPNYPGPKALGPNMERVRKEGTRCDTHWLDYCLGCNRCEMACPNEVNVSELLARAKLQQAKGGRAALRNWLLARPDLLGALCRIAPALTNRVLQSRPQRHLMSKILQIGKKRPFPKYHAPKVVINDNGAVRKTVFFTGCFMRHNDPKLMQSVVDILQLHSRVQLGPKTCCGVPALANGDRGQLMRNLRANVEALIPMVEGGAQIVSACTSCGHMLKAEYPRLLKDDHQLAGLARSISEQTYDLAEYLIEFGGKCKQELRPQKLRLAYHAPCHLKGQGIGRPWLRILRAMPGITIEEMAAECCGMAGTYGFKEEKYQISMDIGEELFSAIRKYGPDLAVSECSTCRMQIEHGTAVEALHPVEILRRAIG
jgi:glycerol-3-phosphate dehydrogenase subunit C